MTSLLLYFPLPFVACVAFVAPSVNEKWPKMKRRRIESSAEKAPRGNKEPDEAGGESSEAPVADEAHTAFLSKINAAVEQEADTRTPQQKLADAVHKFGDDGQVTYVRVHGMPEDEILATVKSADGKEVFSDIIPASAKPKTRHCKVCEESYEDGWWCRNRSTRWHYDRERDINRAEQKRAEKEKARREIDAWLAEYATPLNREQALRFADRYEARGGQIEAVDEVPKNYYLIDSRVRPTNIPHPHEMPYDFLAHAVLFFDLKNIEPYANTAYTTPLHPALMHVDGRVIAPALTHQNDKNNPKDARKPVLKTPTLMEK